MIDRETLAREMAQAIVETLEAHLELGCDQYVLNDERLGEICADIALARIAKARAEALEEAIKVVRYFPGAQAAIRALIPAAAPGDTL